MKKLPAQYDHKEAEPRLQHQWEYDEVYAWDESQTRENTFVIDTPPPTVSGILHMGHIFSYTQADFIARYQRMKGKTVFYPMGFDDNGLPTERLVEKEKKVRGNSMPREEFVALCREVVKDAENEFRRLFKSTGLSIDWNQEYQTISDDVRRLSQESFLDLLASGEAYRDFRPTYWDWVDQTAIAQAEIENKEMPGVMNEIQFTLEDGSPLVIATTRPELLGACVAVMYHPEDPKADDYKDKYAITPLFGVKVPMIADALVEQGKGTGLVMCCTFGDDTDKEWWRKYKLPMRPILATDGRVNVGFTGADSELPPSQTSPSRGEGLSPTSSAYSPPLEGGVRGGVELSTSQSNQIFFLVRQPNAANLTDKNTVNIKNTISIFEKIHGLKPKQAQAKIFELLQAEGVLLSQTPITHTVKCAERSGTPIEIIPTYQWFIKIVDKKEALLAKGNECQWHPEYMHIRLNQWIEGLKEDWCISRQRFFGVPFPVWFSTRAEEEGRILVPEIDQLPIDPFVDLPVGYTRDEVIASTDVMDTWATSSISPQINARAIKGGSDRYEKLFPADIRPQAHEIIRTWAFYTIVKAHLHGDSIPWKNLMISGWCLAADKTKMSKSKGNVVTPVDLILDKGADAVRYWASTSRLGADTAFSEDFLKIGRKLVNKLWNASNFVALHLEKITDIPVSATDDINQNKITETLDKWILTRLHKTIVKATQEFENFEYCDARIAIEAFFWNDFCDNYLELVKVRAYSEGTQSANLTLYHCLNAVLRLFAPFIPHVTEEIYCHLFDSKYSVHARGNWLNAEDYPLDNEAEKTGIACVNLLEAVRKAKSEKQVSIKFPINEMRIASVNTNNTIALETVVEDLKGAGNIGNVTFVEHITNEVIRTDDGLFNIILTFDAAK